MNSTSGFFLFDESKIYDSIQTIRNVFSDSNNHFLLGYSLKANYDKNLIRILNDEDILFDCASEKELNLLLENNINHKKISVNTPYLTKELVDKCFLLGIFIYADSFKQLMLLNERAKSFDKKIEVGIRLNLHEYSSSRFGIEINKFNSQKIQTFFNETSHLDLFGIHSHYSPSERSAVNFKNRLDCFFKIITQYFKTYNIGLINLGGGFSGEMPPSLAAQFNYDIPSWKDYRVVYEEIREKYKIEEYKIVIEPGMGLAVNAYNFVAEVVDIKKIQNKTIALLNTSTLFLKPTGHSKLLDFEVETFSKIAPETKEYTLVGISCMENDFLGNYFGYLEIGTKIIFKNVGAYTLSYRENFIFNQPRVVST